MDPQKILAKNGISQANIEQICQLLKSRIEDKQLTMQADVLLESMAVDIAMGAIEMSQENQAAMGDALSAIALIEVLTGCSFTEG